jgi:VWFA-related protein
MPRSVRPRLNSRERTRAAIILAATWLTILPALASAGSHGWQKEKLPKPRQLDKEITWTRDLASGELKTSSPSENAPPGSDSARRLSHAIIGPAVRMVVVTCTVSGPGAAPLLDLGPKDFRVFDDGIEKEVATFIAPAKEPAGVALVIDASPSVLRDAKEMTDAARALMDVLYRNDEVAVVDFSAHTYLQSGFSSDRNVLSRAIARVDVRSLLGDRGGSNIYEAVYLTAQGVFAPRRHARNAIVLFTDGQDSGLGLTLDPASAAVDTTSGRLTFEDVIRTLTADDIQVFAISTENRPKIMTPQWLEAHRNSTLLTSDARKSGIPAYTLYLAELARSTGGQLYFLHEASSLADTFQQIGRRVNAEYWLGFTPDPLAGVAPHIGWHSLRVSVTGHEGATVVYRPSYYVPAGAK